MTIKIGDRFKDLQFQTCKVVKIIGEDAVLKYDDGGRDLMRVSYIEYCYMEHLRVGDEFAWNHKVIKLVEVIEDGYGGKERYIFELETQSRICISTKKALRLKEHR
jgi:hypothetical protein